MSEQNPTLLQINASIFGNSGQSSQLSADFVADWQRLNPNGRVVNRDLAAPALPHFDAEYVLALSTAADQRSAEQAERVALADALIEELKNAQVLVIGLPMYNFGIPSQLKVWIDYVSRAGSTFHYTNNGPEGLAGDRLTVLFATRGGAYKDTPADSQTPFMRTVLNFWGIRDVHTVYAENLARGERSQEQSLAQAHAQAARLQTDSVAQAA